MSFALETFNKTKSLKANSLEYENISPCSLATRIFSPCLTLTKGFSSSIVIFNFDGSIIQIDALGSCELMLRIEFFSDTKYYKADTLNSFDAFRRTLWNFIDTIKNKETTNSLL